MRNISLIAKTVNNLVKRIITGTVFGIVMITAILYSYYSCLVVFGVIIYFLIDEYWRLTSKFKFISILIGIFGGTLFGWAVHQEFIRNKYLLVGIIGIMTILALRELKVDKPKSLLVNWSTTFGLLYIILPFYFLFMSSDKGFGFEILYFFIIVWAADTFAYFVGRAFGKTKLWPSVSPKKTIEGFIGGAVGAIVVALIYNHFLQLFSISVLILSSIAITVFAMYGDLVESKFKRNLEIKDSGALLPGHGGILDRFDGVLLSAPIYFLIIRYLPF